MNYEWETRNIAAELKRLIRRIEGLPSKSEFTEALGYAERAHQLLGLGERRPRLVTPICSVRRRISGPWSLMKRLILPRSRERLNERHGHAAYRCSHYRCHRYYSPRRSHCDGGLQAMEKSPMSGLSDSQRLALKCGNEPYADDIICPTCNGDGVVNVYVAARVGTSAQVTVSGKHTCAECRGLGYVTAPAIRRAHV